MEVMGYEVDQEFWGDRLEVNIELVAKEFADEDRRRGWIKFFSPRCRTILLGRFGIDASELTLDEVRDEFFGLDEALLPYRLVDAAIQGKRGYALREIGRMKLSSVAFEACRMDPDEDKYDRNALAWSLYVEDPEHLELVHHLDRTQRKGFARMVLDPAPVPTGADMAAFLVRTTVQAVVSQYETDKQTLRESYCAAVLHDSGNIQVFIKRDGKSGMVSHGAKNTFGFEREWIILEFEPDLRRVYICSESPDVPLVLANRIASRFFGTDVAYKNEEIAADKATVLAFLKAVVDTPDELPLVEIVVKNCGLAGSPQVRLNNQEDESLAPAIKDFADAFGDPLEVVDDIESIKVRAFDKRVKMIFEPGARDGTYVARYADQPLNGSERRAFETMFEAQYHIKVLSTEKRGVR